MTAHSGTPNLMDLLTLNIAEGCRIGCALVGAPEGRLHLAEGLDWLRPRLTAAGIALVPEPLAAAPTAPAQVIAERVRMLPAAPGAPTDVMDIGLELHAADDASAAMVQFDRVAALWATRDRLTGLAHLALLLERQLAALAGGTALLAEPMLRLLARLGDFEGSAVSPAVKGLLTVLAGGQPSRVETMALRISGLADSDLAPLEDREVVLSDAAQELISGAGIWPASGSVTAAPAPLEPAPNADPGVTSAPVAFARLRILEQDFDVAEAEGTDRYWYKPAGSDAAWRPLASSPLDGWNTIAVEIIGQSFDITSEFAQMHTIRRRDLPTDEVAEAYELHGTIWWIRDGETGPEARLDDGAWQAIASGDEATASRKRAVNALLEVRPEVAVQLSSQVRDWANRMAHAVQVIPQLGVAAE